MKIYTRNQNAIVTAVTPIPRTKLCSVPFLLPVDGKLTTTDVYSIPGNALRGLGRRLLFRHVFTELLGADFDKTLAELPALHRDGIASLFENGGSKKELGTMTLDEWSSTYREILKDLPMLDLLGGVFMSQVFRGKANIGSPVLRTQETQKFFEAHRVFEHSSEPLPHLAELKAEVERTGHLVHESFFWTSSLMETPFEGTVLAFDAFLSLIARHKWIGRLTVNGALWHADIQFNGMDPMKAIQLFDEFLLDNKQNVLDGIRLLAESFHYAPESAVLA